MACVELDGRILIVDVGLSFPHAEMPGIDLVLPDFEYVRERFDDVEAIVLTHGHQDHIGALPYLLREFDGDPLPVYGTAFTLALLEGQLEEHEVRDRAEFRQVTPGEAAVAGPFSMRFLRVTHSIPDGMAVVIDTPYGSILHTGDFKIDQTPLDGRATDLHALAEEAGRGVHLLLSDSTNAEESGYTDSERSVGPVLQDIIARAPQLVVVACFSSHIHRIQQVVNAARARRARGRVPRPLDAPERRGGSAARDPARARGRRDPDRGGRAPRPVPRGRRLHGLAGGTVLGPEPDGGARAQVGQAQGGRQRRAVVEPDPGQRARDPPRDRRALPDRRGRVPPAGVPGARERPRGRRGAPADAVPRAPAVVHPDPRRAASPRPPREDRDRGRHRRRPRPDLRGRRRGRGRGEGARDRAGARPA